jgi:hypothetical protein
MLASLVLDLERSASATVRNKFLLFQPFSLQYLLWMPKLTKTDFGTKKALAFSGRCRSILSDYYEGSVDSILESTLSHMPHLSVLFFPHPDPYTVDLPRLSIQL